MAYQSCTYCGSRLHTVANCPETWSGSSHRHSLHCGYCGYCGAQGYTSKACPHNASSARRRELNDNFYLDWLNDTHYQKVLPGGGLSTGDLASRDSAHF